jgi:hypothetical protein
MKRRYRAIGSPTKAQQAQQDLQRAHGCAACLLRGNRTACGPVRIHHRTVGDLHGNKQLGQDHTVALGDWHHQGVLMEDRSSFHLRLLTVDQMRERFGPSLHHHKRDFVTWIQDVLGERSTAALQRWQDEQIQQKYAA